MATALLIGFAAGQTMAEEIETITTIGSRPDSTVARAPTSFATRIELADRRLELETAPDLLAETVGVHVRRFGGLGSFSTVSIRGSSPNQVQFFLDGVPISQAQSETLDLSTLPVDSVETIEVFRGTVPIGFGGSGATNVVNLITRQPTEEATTEALATYGSFGTYRFSATHAQRLGKVAVLGHFGALGSEGDYKFRSFAGTESDPSDDFDERRENNDFDSVEGLLSATWDISPDTRLRFTEEAMFRESGIQGPNSAQTEATSRQNIRSVTHLGLAADRFPFDAIYTSVNLFAVYQQLDFDDPLHELGPVQDSRDGTVSLGANSLFSLYSLPYQTVSWFTEAAYENFDPYNQTSTPPDLPDQRRTRVSASLQDEIGLLDARLFVVPIVRYHHIEDRFSGSDVANRPSGPTDSTVRDLWSPSIGIAATVIDGLQLKANLGRFERPPSLFELFGNNGTVTPSPDLVPETAINRDVGFQFRLDDHRPLRSVVFDYAYFNNDIEDLIGLRAVSPQSFKASNFENVHLRGHEISGHLRFDPGVSIIVNYTRQESKNLSARPSEFGKPLPLLPRDELFLRTILEIGPATFHYEYSFTGPNSATPSALDTAERRDVHTVGISLEPFEHLAFAIEVVNLTDNTVFSLTDFPLPGRALRGTVRATF